MKKYVTARDGRIRPDYLDDDFVEKIEAIMPHGSNTKLLVQKIDFMYTMPMIILMIMACMTEFFLLSFVLKMVNLPIYIFMI